MAATGHLLANYFGKKKPVPKLKADSVWFEKEDQDLRGAHVKAIVSKIQELGNLAKLAAEVDPQIAKTYFAQLLQLKQKLRSLVREAHSGCRVMSALEPRRGYLLGKRGPIRQEYRDCIVGDAFDKGQTTLFSILSSKEFINHESGNFSLSEISKLASLKLVKTCRSLHHGDIEDIIKITFLPKDPREYLSDLIEVSEEEDSRLKLPNKSVLVVSARTGSGIFSLISRPPVNPLSTWFGSNLLRYELIPGGYSLFINNLGEMCIFTPHASQLPVQPRFRCVDIPKAISTNNLLGSRQAPASKSPLYLNRKLYFFSTEDKLCVIDAQQGVLLRTFPVRSFFQDVEIAGDRIYLLSERGQIAILNEKTGNLDILGTIELPNPLLVCVGFKIYNSTVLVFGMDAFSYEVPKSFVVVGEMLRSKIQFGEPLYYSRLMYKSDPYEKYQSTSEDQKYQSFWKPGAGNFQNDKNAFASRYQSWWQESGFSADAAKSANHGHTQGGAAGVLGRGRGRGRGRGGAVAPPAGPIIPPGWPPAPPRGGFFGGALAPAARGGFEAAALRGAAHRGRGGFAGLGPGGLFPHIPMGGGAIPPPLGPELADEGEEDDLEEDIHGNPQNPGEQGADFDFYQNTPIPRIKPGKPSDNVFVRQVKALRYIRGIILIIVHEPGTVSLLAISRTTPYMLSTSYLQDPSDHQFSVKGISGDLEIVFSKEDPLLISPFFREVLKQDSDPFFIYGCGKHLSNMVLLLDK